MFTVATGNDNVRLAVQWAIAEATGAAPAEEEAKDEPAMAELEPAELRFAYYGDGAEPELMQFQPPPLQQ